MRSTYRLLLVFLLVAVACASSPPKPAEPPPPPGDPDLATLTQWLKLDAEQQKKTRELLDQLAERNARLREKWEKQHRVRQEELMVSRSIFLRDFIAILTEDQKKIYAQANLDMQRKARSRPSS